MKTLNRPKHTLRLESESCQAAIDKIKAVFKFQMTNDVKSKIQFIQEQKDEFDKALKLIEKWERGGYMKVKFVNQAYWDILPSISYMSEPPVWYWHRPMRHIIFIGWLKWNIQIQW